MKKIFSIILIFVIIFLHITVYASSNSDNERITANRIHTRTGY